VKRDLERLTLVDLTNLAVEAQDTPMHQGALGILDGEQLLDADGCVRIGRIRAHLEGMLAGAPALRRRLWQTGPFEGRPLWVDDSAFRIEDHVLMARLPWPGGERAAVAFAEAKMAGLMDRSHPLWQMWFLEGYGSGRVGMFLKLHHALADGMAILNIIAVLCGTEPGLVEPATEAWSAAAPPTHGLLLRDNLARKGALILSAGTRLVHPLAFVRSTAASWQGLFEMLRKGWGAPRTSLNRPISSRRSIAVLRLRLDGMKQVAHARSVKVNDVILDVVAGGLRHVLVSRGERVEGTSIKASMAVLLPSSERSSMVGNHAGTVIVPLPVEEGDPVQRLAVIAAATARAKRTQRGTVSQVFMVLLALSGLTRFFIRRQHLVNVLVTNLAGPQFPLYVAGAQVLDAFAITPIAGNVTASFAALSYDGALDLSVHVDADAWPDLDILARGMSSTWQELLASEAVPEAEGCTALSA
jgi:WS/DGAT/MGAT family acyltransferase